MSIGFFDPRVVCDEAGDKCVFQVLPVLHVTDLITPMAGFRRSILLSEMPLSCFDSWDSHSVYDISLGLHHYLWNGGRSRVEIKVDFHEGAVSLSMLLDL